MLHSMELKPQEIRVLGCLVEKERTTPQQYPMTENALITACNQTTNRDPIVAYDQSTVRRTLLGLRQQGLAKMVHRPGDRSEKHKHLLDAALELPADQIAVLSVLMLRGPQTVAELRTRTERLHAFGSLGDVEAVLGALMRREPEPLVARLERRPGQKEARFAHLLLGDEEEDAQVIGRPADAERPARGAAPAGLAELAEEVAALRQRVLRLERELGLEGVAAPHAPDAPAQDWPPRDSPAHHVPAHDLSTQEASPQNWPAPAAPDAPEPHWPRRDAPGQD